MVVFGCARDSDGVGLHSIGSSDGSSGAQVNQMSKNQWTLPTIAGIL